MPEEGKSQAVRGCGDAVFRIKLTFFFSIPVEAASLGLESLRNFLPLEQGWAVFHV